MDLNTSYNYPDANGKFGIYGGKYVPETLIAALNDLEKLYEEVSTDNNFKSELDQ